MRPRLEITTGSGAGSNVKIECDPQDDADVDDIEVITVENFNEESTKRPILTSPRSIEACRMLGIEPEELVKRSLEYFIAHASPGEDLAFLEKRAIRYEKNRQNQLQHVRQQRDELIDAELHGVHGGMSLRTRSFCHSPLSAKLSIGRHSESVYKMEKVQSDISVIEREKRELERMKLRQAQEMQQLLSFEMKMAEIHRERELKEQEHRKQQELLMREKIKRQREADELRRRKELEKAEEQRLEVERARLEAQERQREMKHKAEQEERERERRRREQQQYDKERARKAEEQRQLNEMMQQQLQLEAERKAREVEQREERRRQLLDYKKRQKALEAQEKQQRNKMRITSVLQDRDYIRQVQIEEQLRKQHESEERRKRFEDERRRREDEIRLQGMRKKEVIDLVQQQLQQIEQQRRERLLEQERDVANRLKAQELEKQRIREEQKREEQRQEEERRQVYLRMEQQMKQRQLATLTKAEQKSAIAKMVHRQKKHMIRSRLHEAKMREEEIQAALTRKQKQEEYRVNLLLTRIESDNERARAIKEQREQLVRRRQQIKMEATRQKQQLLDSFYKMKITKKYELPEHLQKRLVMARPQSESFLQTRSLTRDDSDKCFRVSQRPPLPKRPSSAVARSSASKQLRGSNSPQARQSGSPSTYEDEINENELGIHDDNEVEREEVFENELDELRRKQNEELLLVLQQEHHAEEQREYLLQQVGSPRERERMEQIFNKERAQASERIMKLTQQHEQAVQARMRNR